MQQLLNAREKVFRPQWEFLPETIPSLPVSFASAGSDGILNFKHSVRTAHRTGQVNSHLTFDISRLSFGIATLLIVSLAFLSACSQRHNQKTGSSVATREVVDDVGRRLTIPEKIDRIVSLAPNLTEIVYAVGAGDRLVGDTTYCDYPEAAKSIAKVGDTMQPSIERIIALQPQIVLVSTASQLEAFTNQLEQQRISVYVTNPRNLDEVFRSIGNLGDVLGNHQPAYKLVEDLSRRTDAVQTRLRDLNAKPVRVFFQLSDQPLYTIGRDAFQTDLIRRAGGVSVTEDLPTAFPTFSDEAALASKPDAIILPVSGHGSGNSTVAAALKNSPAVLNNRVYKISEDHLSRPGPRLVDGLEEMARALHPEAFK